MKERAINLRGWEVRAFLDGRKTQLRRIVKWPCLSSSDGSKRRIFTSNDTQEMNRLLTARQKHPTLRGFCPFGQPGDRLWGRETHAIFATHGQHREDGQRWGPWGGLPTTVSPDGTQIAYYRDGFDRCDPGRWRSPIHMSRWASRITLEVVGVRVERLQDISTEDCWANGIPFSPDVDPSHEYRELWESTNGPGSWDANPWTWAIEVKAVQP
jgi:hypothetical protein